MYSYSVQKVTVKCGSAYVCTPLTYSRVLTTNFLAGLGTGIYVRKFDLPRKQSSYGPDTMQLAPTMGYGEAWADVPTRTLRYSAIQSIIYSVVPTGVRSTQVPTGTCTPYKAQEQGRRLTRVLRSTTGQSGR